MNAQHRVARSEDWHLYLAVPKGGERFKVGIAATADLRLRNLDLTDLDMDRSMFLAGSRSLISRAERALHFLLDQWHSPLEHPRDGYTEWFGMDGVLVARDQLAGLAFRDDRMSLFSVVFFQRPPLPVAPLLPRKPETSRTSAEEPAFYVLDATGSDRSGFGCMPSDLDASVEWLSQGDILVFRKVATILQLGQAKVEALAGSIREAGARLAIPGILDPCEVLSGPSELADGQQLALITLLSRIAQQEHETRRERQEQGITLAKARGAYTGRKADADRHELIRSLRAAGNSIAQTAKLANCSASLVKLVMAADKASATTAQAAN